jgi:hypothetical protein
LGIYVKDAASYNKDKWSIGFIDTL